jgi:6-pyruvoyltetrahydropterin/6-carboxytetrahydropterin synthase
MRATLVKSFRFEAAHFVPTFPAGHPCARMHGHSYKIEVVIEGEVDPAKGYVIDFRDIKRAYKPVEETLDHQMLNDIPGLEIPTSEVLSKWIYDRLKPSLPLLKTIRVYETATSYVEYHGE